MKSASALSHQSTSSSPAANLPWPTKHRNDLSQRVPSQHLNRIRNVNYFQVKHIQQCLAHKPLFESMSVRCVNECDVYVGCNTSLCRGVVLFNVTECNKI